jgi:hypothetical protein
MLVVDGTDSSDLRGRVVRGSNGKILGRVVRVYLDELTDAPVWVTVRLGTLARSECFVPIGTSRLDEPELRVPYSRDTVQDAPYVEPTPRIDVGGEIELHRYYGLLWR